jgi:hypothetical protein
MEKGLPPALVVAPGFAFMDVPFFEYAIPPKFGIFFSSGYTPP